MPLEIRQIPCLSDNYGYIIRDDATGETASIDTPDPVAINEALEKEGWRLTHILNTHHHWDHAGGNEALKDAMELQDHWASKRSVKNPRHRC